jgi:tRNA (guanine26-N2/guanine27-N2)-dimethyltransferase
MSSTTVVATAEKDTEMDTGKAPVVVCKGDEATDAATAANTKSNLTTITEGSVKMCYPADQAEAVFYNPVQVQNRDLSILMITLAAERRAIRNAVVAKKKELRQQQQDQQAVVGSSSNGNGNADNASSSSLKEQLAAYRTELENNPSAALQAQSSSDVADNNNDQGLTILDALAASGLRSMRYWREIPGVKHVTINDLDPAAVERAHTNLQVNELTDVLVGAPDTNTDDPRARGIRVQHGDATHEMYSSRKPAGFSPKQPDTTAPPPPTPLQPPYPQWDVIDLDPYGSAAPFLDGAVQAVQDGGLLCITCTDMAALGGSHPETCFGRYAAMPIPRAGYLQEMAVRILLQSTASSAARYGRSIKPILSVGMNFYVRVFVEVYNDKAGVHAHSLNIGTVYQSTQCPSFQVAGSGQMGGKKGTCYQPDRAPKGACEETGAAFKIGGPFWLGPMHDVDVVKEALQRLESKDEATVPAMKWIATKERLRGLLMSCRDELPDAPLFYRLPDLSQALAISTPPITQFKAALMNAGYRVSGYHKEPQAVKTNAPNSVVWDIMRAWCKTNPPKKVPAAGSVAEKIIAVEPSIEVDFSIPKGMKLSREQGVARFPVNPQPNWGPKPKASGHKRKAEGDAKTPLDEKKSKAEGDAKTPLDENTTV